MLATLGKPPTRYDDWAVEAKYDGQRGIAVVDGDTVTLWSRNGANITRTFPEISSSLASYGQRLILDGEIVALDEAGVPSFSRLQRRWPQNRRPTADLLRLFPIRFYVFDILEFSGQDITRQPYTVRRDRLTNIASDTRGCTVQFPTSWTDTDPATVLAASAEVGLEGIVCKHLDSPYTAGLRSRDWVKTPHRRRSSFVIGGWLPGAGVNQHTVGAVLVGAYAPDGQLMFCGAVAAGLSAPTRRRLTGALKPLQRKKSPFNHVPDGIAMHARWVHPELVGDVDYREFHRGLRHPSWKGLRTDLGGERITLCG